MKYRLAIFDLDGTLLNTLDDLAASVNHALEKNSLPQRTVSEVKSFVGNGIKNLIKRAVPNGTSDEQTEIVFSDFKEYYASHCADSTRPYEGVNELLGRLRESGVMTSVLSNKADFAVKTLCEDYFPGLLDSAVGEREADGIPKKPAPDAVDIMLEQLGVAHRDAVYIGDSDVDVQTARNAGLDLIAVNWGFRERELLKKCGAETIVSTADELFCIITDSQ